MRSNRKNIKLQINRETVRNLCPDDLQSVAGGARALTDRCDVTAGTTLCPTNVCWSINICSTDLCS